MVQSRALRGGAGARAGTVTKRVDQRSLAIRSRPDKGNGARRWNGELQKESRDVAS